MVMTSVRLEAEQIARLDKVAAALEKRVPGVKVSRSDAIRVATERGLLSFEAELRLPSPEAA